MPMMLVWPHSEKGRSEALHLASQRSPPSLRSQSAGPFRSLNRVHLPLLPSPFQRPVQDNGPCWCGSQPPFIGFCRTLLTLCVWV